MSSSSAAHKANRVSIAFSGESRCNQRMPGFRRRVFVVMPFGKKEVPKKPRADLPADRDMEEKALKVDFDAVYRELFHPALEAAKLQPFRADDERAAGD